MDNVQNCDSYINIPSSQTYISEHLRSPCCVYVYLSVCYEYILTFELLSLLTEFHETVLKVMTLVVVQKTPTSFVSSYSYQ
jgi:hypothetical protein